jgi:hypothetical protein
MLETLFVNLDIVVLLHPFRMSNFSVKIFTVYVLHPPSSPKQYHYSRILIPSGWCRPANKPSTPTLSNLQHLFTGYKCGETLHIPCFQISLNLFCAIVNYDTHLCKTLFTNQFVIRKPL